MKVLFKTDESNFLDFDHVEEKKEKKKKKKNIVKSVFRNEFEMKVLSTDESNFLDFDHLEENGERSIKMKPSTSLVGAKCYPIDVLSVESQHPLYREQRVLQLESSSCQLRFLRSIENTAELLGG